MKIFKFLLAGFVLIFILLSVRYILNINVAGSFDVININNDTKIIAITPLGREVTKSNDFKGFYKEIRIENSDGLPLLIQRLNNIETNIILKKDKDVYFSVNNELSFYDKIHALFLISLKHILFFIIIIFLLYYVLKTTNQFFKRDDTKFLDKIINKPKLILEFIKKEHFKILLPITLAFIPGFIYLFFKPDLAVFLDANYTKTFIFLGLIILPQIFFIYYHKKLSINLYFWLSFLIIFILYYFILCPEYYIYGKLFRDDISKFFVKAASNNFFDLLTSLNANYLNTYQSGMSYFILRVLGIKNYFPEFLQLAVLLTIVLIYASFNLKVFRVVCKDDKWRLIISIICAFIGPFCGYIMFLYDVPFLAALLFWAVVFIKMEHVSSLVRFVILIFFAIFMLSKPIFIVYLPILAFLTVIAFYHKKKNSIIVYLIWIIIIVFHFVIYNSPDNVILLQYSADGLGVEQTSDFRYDSIPFAKVIELGVFVYVRLLTKILYPFEMISKNIILILNIFLLIFHLMINIWLIIRYIRTFKREYVFFLTGNALALMTTCVFVKTVSLDMLLENGNSILDYNSIDYIFSAYIPPAHRYLILGYVPLIASALFFITYYIKRITGLSEKIQLYIFSIYFISISVFFYKNVIFSDEKFCPKYSLWRQYSDMIYDYPDNYYMPYYDYPKQNESIKSGINRITDVYVSNTGTVLLDDVHSKGSQWDIIQIITEYEPLICPEIKKLICVTNNNDTLLFEPLKPVNEKYRFIIFRFDDFLMLKEFKFVDKNNAPLQLKNFIRLVGKYE